MPNVIDPDQLKATVLAFGDSDDVGTADAAGHALAKDLADVPMPVLRVIVMGGIIALIGRVGVPEVGRWMRQQSMRLSLYVAKPRGNG